jgi:Peptidase A4 family
VTKSGDVSHVAGSWQVPNLKCALGEDSGASQWIGLDGLNAGLVQTGVVSRCARGVQLNLAFYQVLPKNAKAQYLSPHTNVVLNGDFIDAEIRHAKGKQYSISLQDGWWNFSKTVTYDGAPKTAEWIVESGENFGSVDKLSNFGTVHFEAALFNERLVTNQDTNKFMAAGKDGSPKTKIADIEQRGGHGPNFDVKWLRP